MEQCFRWITNPVDSDIKCSLRFRTYHSDNVSPCLSKSYGSGTSPAGPSDQPGSEMPEAWHVVLRQNSCRCVPTPARLSHLPVPKTKAIGLAPSSVQRWIRHAQDKLYALHGVSRKNRFQYSSDCMMMWMSSSSSFKGDRLALLLYMPFSSRRSMVWCLWFCARGWCLKRPNTSDLPRSKLLVLTALPKIKRVGYLVLGF